MDVSARIKHLEMIQAVITRLANISVLMKGWGVTLVSALMALGAAKDGDPRLILVAMVPLISFAVLDAYYLWLERRYRAHFEVVRKNADRYDFDMRLPDVEVERVSGILIERPAVWIFWLGLLACDVLALAVLWR